MTDTLVAYPRAWRAHTPARSSAVVDRIELLSGASAGTATSGGASAIAVSAAERVVAHAAVALARVGEREPQHRDGPPAESALPR